MDGVLKVINMLGLTIALLEQQLAAAQQRIAELEARVKQDVEAAAEASA